MTRPRGSLGSGDEAGQSLVEVMVAVVILTVAIVPMVGMFDAALQAIDASGDYDHARACAGQKLEQAKSLPYETVNVGLPDGDCAEPGFDYAIDEEPVGTDLQEGSGDEGLTKVTVTVNWDVDDSYSLMGVVSRW